MLYFPFDSVVSDDGEGNLSYDREFNSAKLRKIFHGLYTNGVAMSDDSGAFQVIPDSGMNLTVKSGFVIIEGAMGRQESDLTVVVDAAHATYTRIDAIMVRLNTNLTGRCITIEYVKGTETSAPSAPAVVRSGGIYDLRLANIRIPAGATAITGSMITDTRLGAECGIATARPQEIDVTSIFSQYQASLAEYMQYVQDCINGTVAGQLDTRLSTAEGILENINASLTSINRTLTELVSARNVITGFSFNNPKWKIDYVYCVGRIVFIKGNVLDGWSSLENAVKYSNEDSETAAAHAVYLTIPAGYAPLTPAELIFGARGAYWSQHGDELRFQLNHTASKTNSDGSTDHLIYGFSYNMRSLHHFQIIYIRTGSV